MTDWIAHDGMGCPCEGRLVRVQCFGGHEETVVAGSICQQAGITTSGYDSGWAWSLHRRPLRKKDISAYQLISGKGFDLLKEAVESPETFIPVKESA